MLAYMDDILEPADAKEVGRRIEESEFATNLMHRTRDVTRRLRLGAPRIDGKGMGLDANTVAEYLDHNLPAERVPDFERVCLESDVHLAEVASCHQILALVLGEAAEVDPVGRSRMHRLIHESHPPSESEKPEAEKRSAHPQENIAVATEARRGESKRRKKRKKPAVPDYMREPATHEGRSGRKWLVAAAAIVFVATLAVLFREDLGNAFQKVASGPAEQAPNDGDSPDQVEKAKKEPAETAAAAERGEQPEKAPKKPAEEQVAEPDETAADKLPPPDEASAKETAEADRADVDGLKQPQAAERGPDQPGREPPVPNGDAAPAPVETSEPGIDDPGNGEPAAAERAEADSPAVGRLTTEHDVLLRLPPEGDWQRVANRGDALYPGDSLLALPAFHPDIAAGGLTVTLCGGTAIKLGSADVAGLHELFVEEGRLVLVFTIDKAEIRLKIKDGPTVTLVGDHEATAGIEIRRTMAPGADPEKDAASVLVDLYVPSGDVIVRGADDREVAVASPSKHVLQGPPDEAAEDADAKGKKKPAPLVFPAWVSLKEVSDIDRKAAEFIDRRLQPHRPVSLSLKELAKERRVEVSSLAMRCLARTGEFDSCVPVLNDSLHKSYWDSLIDSLRAALCRDAATATLVRQAFERQCGDDGEPLYRMLRGYADADLAVEAQRLVRDLSHEHLNFRVLAFWNLREITGSSLNYRPELSEAKRRESIHKWDAKLKKGEIDRK